MRIESIKMVGFCKAEVTFRTREDANKMLQDYERSEDIVGVFLPIRKKFRKGVIRDWVRTMEELQEEATAGQGEYVLERLGRRSREERRDGKGVVGEPLLIIFRGDTLPVSLLIGQGHVGVRIWPYVERVKQCYRCWRFGHIMKFCKGRRSLCGKCGKDFHGKCEEEAKCVNCKGNHAADEDRKCWMFQKEYAIKKVMAYRNVEFETAKEVIERTAGIESVRGKKDERNADEGSREFPGLQQKKIVDAWEKREVPIGGEMERIRKGIGLDSKKVLHSSVVGGVKKRYGGKRTEEGEGGWSKVVLFRVRKKTSGTGTGLEGRKEHRSGRIVMLPPIVTRIFGNNTLFVEAHTNTNRSRDADSGSDICRTSETERAIR
ncbi:uncharacterized protein LOC143266637 [Megachile rotundata]|uniref:uncharacterized protein LOC143266637 n=1 Tax=Megachile rotundata TaxID=143995 RepID=UPI003FD57AE7